MRNFFAAIAVIFMFLMFSATVEAKPELTGRILVKLDEKCLEKGRDKCVKSLGCSEAGELTLKNWALLKCDGEPKTKADAFIKKGLKASPERFVKHRFYSIESIGPLYLNDKYMKEQWNFHNTGNVTAADEKMIVDGKDHAHIAEAWTLLRILGAVSINSELGKERKLAIIDDGFDIRHEDIKDGVVASKNFGDDRIETDNLFSNRSAAKNYHGTLVTGIAAARGNNGVGLAGACPACSLILARITGNPEDVGSTYETYYDLIFRWVMEQGAEVVNCSWGFIFDQDGYNTMREYYDELFEYAATQANGGKGTLFIFASGNEGSDFTFNPFATNTNVIAVGATNSNGKRYSFSSYGPQLGLMAPTAGGDYENSFSGKNFVDRIWTTDNYIDPGCGSAPSSDCHEKAGWNPEGNYAGGDDWVGKYSYRFSHTSSAAPLVAGVAAIVLEANPDLTALELKEILTSTADQVSKSDAGYDVNGHSNYYGYGRVNALRAVAAAWIKGGGVITADIKNAIDAVSPCTKDDCWDFEGVEYPDYDMYDYDPDTVSDDDCSDTSDNEYISDSDDSNAGSSDIDTDDPEPEQGELGGECYPDGTCGNGLLCRKADNICFKAEEAKSSGCSVVTIE